MTHPFTFHIGTTDNNSTTTVTAFGPSVAFSYGQPRRFVIEVLWEPAAKKLKPSRFDRGTTLTLSWFFGLWRGRSGNSNIIDGIGDVTKDETLEWLYPVDPTEGA